MDGRTMGSGIPGWGGPVSATTQVTGLSSSAHTDSAACQGIDPAALIAGFDARPARAPARAGHLTHARHRLAEEDEYDTWRPSWGLSAS